MRESGQKNQSALQYHFGGREGLIAAILNRRAAQLEARRGEILAAATRSETRLGVNAICAILVRAPFTLCRDDPTFRRFLGQFGQRLLASDLDMSQAINLENPPTNQVLHALMATHLGDLDPDILKLRLENTNAFGLLILSRRARRNESFEGVSAELFFNNLVDQVAGMLTAPISAATREQLTMLEPE